MSKTNGMKYLYIIYKGSSQKFYVKSTQVDGISQDNKIRYHFYKNSPPYILLIVIIKIVRVRRGAVLIYFSPPLVGGGKMKINRTQILAEKKIFKSVVSDIKIVL